MGCALSSAVERPSRFHAARALEYAIAGAQIEDTSKEALVPIAAAHADMLGELLDDAEEQPDEPR